MLTFQALLPRLKVPTFVVVHNQDFGGSPEPPWPVDGSTFDVPMDGEVVGTADTPGQALELVPRPNLPNDDKKRMEIGKIYGRRFEPETGKWTLDDEDLHFTTRVFSDHERKSTKLDAELFGETYTIHWVVLETREQLNDALLGAVDQILNGQVAPMPMVRLLIAMRHALDEVQVDDGIQPRFGAEELLLLHRNYLEYLYFHSPPSAMPTFTERMKQRGEWWSSLEQQLSAIPNGPTEADWVEFYELNDK